MDENFINLTKTINTEIQETQQTPNTTNMKKKHRKVRHNLIMQNQWEERREEAASKTKKNYPQGDKDKKNSTFLFIEEKKTQEQKTVEQHF